MSIGSTSRRAVLRAGGAAAAAAFGNQALAQSLPTGTIRVLVGFPPGGGSDVMARYIVEKLRERTGLNIVVENRPGAGGTIAIDAMKKAPTDGTVLMYGTSATTVAQTVTRKVPGFDLDKDLTPIALTGTVCVVYVVSATIGVRTLPEYIAWLKKNPQLATFGTTVLGSSTHFSGVQMGQAIGIPLTPVSYKGAAPLVGDLIAGHVPAGCGGLTDFLTYHQSDKIRIIGITAPKRATAAPELPTFADLGYPGLTYEGFYGFYGPGKMNPAALDAWNRELRAATDSPDLKQRLMGLGLEVQTSTPAEFALRQARLVTSFGESMKATGYIPE